VTTEGQLSCDQLMFVVLTTLGNVKQPKSPNTLTDREIAAIELKSAGHNNTTIGRHLRVSHVAVGKYFAKPLVKACLARFLDSGGKELYPRPIYANRAEKQAARIERQRMLAFRGWLSQRMVDAGTLENPAKLKENLKVIFKENRAFWLDYFAEYEPGLSEAEIAHFFRKE